MSYQDEVDQTRSAALDKIKSLKTHISALAYWLEESDREFYKTHPKQANILLYRADECAKAFDALLYDSGMQDDIGYLIKINRELESEKNADPVEKPDLRPGECF